jgi:hypothetical protein
LSSPELAGNFSFGIWAWVIIGIFMFGWDIKIQIRNLEDGGV